MDNFLKDPQKRKFLLIGIGALLVIFIMATVILLVSNKNNKNKRKTTPGGSTTTTTTGGVSNKDSQKIIYWGLWEPDGVMEEVLEEFEAENPGVTVEYSQQPFSTYESRIYTRLQEATTSSQPAPDVFRIHNTWLPKFMKYLSPLPSSIMSAQEYKEKFYPTTVDDFTGKDGKIYAIPWEIDGLSVFYNKDMFAEANISEVPDDWDTFFEVAQKLTKRDSSGKITQAGVAFGTSRNIQHSAEIISFLLLQNNISIIDDTKTKVTLNTTRAQDVIRTYTNFASGQNSTWSSKSDNDLQLFQQGKLAMMLAPSWRVFDIINMNSKINFDTAPLPQLKANNEEIYYATYWGDTVSSRATNPTLAWKFVKFLSEKEQQLKLHSASSKIRAFGEPYSLVELNGDMKGKQYVDAIAKMAPYMKSWQMGDESFVKATINEAITKIIENGTDVSSALKQAETTINEKLAVTNK